MAKKFEYRQIDPRPRLFSEHSGKTYTEDFDHRGTIEAMNNEGREGWEAYAVAEGVVFFKRLLK